MKNTRNTPNVFISSTCYDLSQVREDLKDFFESNYGFNTLLSEFDSFPIDPCSGTFENCLSNVDKLADIFILIIGTRYGYITDNGKSITNLEYLHAKSKNIPIFVFVSKQIKNNLALWEVNKDGDFSSLVDNAKIFEFVSNIYNEDNQWIYTYDSVRDIKRTMTNQLRLIFFDGLKFSRYNNKTNNILSMDISDEAARAIIEKPYAWEYKFFACTLKYEFDKLNNDKWDLKYGIIGNAYTFDEPSLFIDCVLNKFHEIMMITEVLNTLLNTTVNDALGKPGVPSDLEMIIYSCKALSEQYKRLISWSLYFKCLNVDDIFSNLITLLQEMPKSVLNTLDNYIVKVYKEISQIPDVDDGIDRNINLLCTLDSGNTNEINEEIERLNNLLV